MKYAIEADYYVYRPRDMKSDEDGVITKPVLLGLGVTIGDKKMPNMFIFEENVTEKTKIFNSAKEAGEYVDKYFSDINKRASYKTVRIIELKED